jgi:large subunit ribosomal protein L22
VETQAKSRYLLVTPRKARLVVDMIRGRSVEQALGILEFSAKRAGRMIAKTVKSAVANAENAQSVDVDKLYIARAYVDEGPTLKRFMPRAHGRATPIMKRTSHVTIVVDERAE